MRKRKEKGRKRQLRRGERGFTLIEIMIVVIVLGILAALVVPRFVGRTKEARVTAAKSDIASLCLSVDLFEADTGDYPDDLSELLSDPGVNGWRGPYIKKLSKDPWDNDYTYSPPSGPTGMYTVTCCGEDGSEGTDDDITNSDL